LFYGASGYNEYSGFGTTFNIGSAASGYGSYGQTSSSAVGAAGQPGHVTIVEIF
jgi:hypothetical protein